MALAALLVQRLPSNLRRLRRERDLSQTALAHLAGLQQKDVSLFERGLRPARFELVEQLALALGVDLTVLLGLPLPADNAAAKSPVKTLPP